jgi:hypothetical protein
MGENLKRKNQKVNEEVVRHSLHLYVHSIGKLRQFCSSFREQFDDHFLFQFWWSCSMMMICRKCWKTSCWNCRKNAAAAVHAPAVAAMFIVR